MDRCNCFAHKDMPLAPDSLLRGDAAWEDGKIVKVYIPSARERWGAQVNDNPCNNMIEFKGYGRATTTRMGQVYQMVGFKRPHPAMTGYLIVASSYIRDSSVLVEELAADEVSAVIVNRFGEVEARA